MVYRYDENRKNIVSLSPRCAAHSRARRSRALISLACQLVLVKSGMLDLRSCATSVVLELGGVKQAQSPLAQIVECPGSIHAHPRPR
jgi:hypothetical protein